MPFVVGVFQPGDHGLLGPDKIGKLLRGQASGHAGIVVTPDGAIDLGRRHVAVLGQSVRQHCDGASVKETESGSSRGRISAEVRRCVFERTWIEPVEQFLNINAVPLASKPDSKGFVNDTPERPPVSPAEGLRTFPCQRLERGQPIRHRRRRAGANDVEPFNRISHRSVRCAQSASPGAGSPPPTTLATPSSASL